MANSTWIALTNNVLRQSGLPEIVIDNPNVVPGSGGSMSTAFDNPGQGLMTRFQSCAREFVRVVHEMVSVDLPVNFARRRFDLPIDNIQGPIYNLDSSMSVESVTFNSFRNLSPSPAGPAELRNWSYEYFSNRYGDVTQIWQGAPTHYIFLPVQRQNNSPIYQVRIFPNPDQPYQLEYIAQLNPYQVAVSSDVLLWPPEYEHVITTRARFELEDLLGEGKAGSLFAQADMLYKQMRKKATPSRAERKGVRMKSLFKRRGVYGYYDSPPDSDAPYTAYNPSGL